MSLSALDQTEFIALVVAALILAYLVYRALRGAPLDRIVRLGIFIERVRHRDNGSAEPPEEPAEAETEKHEWPRRRRD